MSKKEEIQKQTEPGRDKEIKVRLTKQEHYVIGEKAHKAGKQLAVYVRDAALNKEIKAVMTPEQLKAYLDNHKQLIGIANNLNQLVAILHKEGIKKYADKVLALIAEINEKLK
jgi:uncharacterized protein (DUF1778 family)